MNFEFDQEKKMLRETLRQFVEKEIPRDYARKLDLEEKFPEDIWEKLAALDVLAIPIDEKYGGTGGDIIDMVIVLEELARRSSAAAFTFFNSSCFGAKSFGFYGSEEQKEKYLRPLAEGKIRFALAMTEPGGGTDILGGLATMAEEKDDCYVINGQKVFITGAHTSDYMIVVTRTSKEEKKSKGISLFVCDVKAPGVEIRGIKTLGLRGTGTNEVFFTDVKVPKENLIGEKGNGWYQLVSTLDNERILTAAVCLGEGTAAVEDAVEYAKQRHAFGRPIGQFQAIQHYLAEAATQMELARLATYKAAWMQSQKIPCAMESTMAKYVAANAAVYAADRAIQVLGGYGYTMEYDVQRYWRDARLHQIGPISNEMCLNFIGERLGLPKSY